WCPSSLVSDGRRITAAGGEGGAFVLSHGGSAFRFSGSGEPLSPAVGRPLRNRQILPSSSLSSSDSGCSAPSTRSCQQPSDGLLTPLAPQTINRSSARVRPTYKRRRYSSRAASIARVRASAIGPASLSLAAPQIKAVASGGALATGAVSRRGGCAPSGRLVVGAVRMALFDSRPFAPCTLLTRPSPHP